MSFLNNLKIVWKVALIVAVMGCAMLAVAAFGTRELSATVDGFGELGAAQSSALNLARAQRRVETYHAALYAVFTEATEAGNAGRLKVATRTATKSANIWMRPSRMIRRAQTRSRASATS